MCLLHNNNNAIRQIDTFLNHNIECISKDVNDKRVRKLSPSRMSYYFQWCALLLYLSQHMPVQQPVPTR